MTYCCKRYILNASQNLTNLAALLNAEIVSKSLLLATIPTDLPPILAKAVTILSDELDFISKNPSSTISLITNLTSKSCPEIEFRFSDTLFRLVSKISVSAKLLSGI